RIAGDFAPARKTFDAGERFARSRATSADLSGFSRGRRGRVDHDLHYLHGPATDGIHGADRRHAPPADTDFDASSSLDHDLLVAGDLDLRRPKRRVPRVRAHGRRASHLGPVSVYAFQ